MNTLSLLNALRAKLGSDYKTAQAFNIERQRVSQYRSGRVVLPDELGVKAADLLELDRAMVLAALAAERTASPDARKALTALVDKLSKSAAALAALFVGASAGYESVRAAACILWKAPDRTARRHIRRDFTRHLTRSLPLTG